MNPETRIKYNTSRKIMKVHESFLETNTLKKKGPKCTYHEGEELVDPQAHEPAPGSPREKGGDEDPGGHLEAVGPATQEEVGDDEQRQGPRAERLWGGKDVLSVSAIIASSNTSVQIILTGNAI